VHGQREQSLRNIEHDKYYLVSEVIILPDLGHKGVQCYVTSGFTLQSCDILHISDNGGCQEGEIHGNGIKTRHSKGASSRSGGEKGARGDSAPEDRKR